MQRRLAPTLYQTQRASFVIFKDDRFKKKGRGEEEVYFSQQERNVLKKLLNRMDQEAQAQREYVETSSEEEHHFIPTAEKRRLAAQRAQDQDLRKIFSAHGVRSDPRLMKALKDWKNKQ